MINHISLEGYPAITDWAEFDSYLGYPKLTLNALNSQLSWLAGQPLDIDFLGVDRVRNIADAHLHHDLLWLISYSEAGMDYLEVVTETEVSDTVGQHVVTRTTTTRNVDPLEKANEIFCAIVDLRKDIPDYRKAEKYISSRRIPKPNAKTTVGRNNLGLLLQQLVPEE